MEKHLETSEQDSLLTENHHEHNNDEGEDLGKWLYYALDFDIYNSKSPHLRKLVNRIYEEIKPYKNLRTSPSRKKQALKTVLINLWKANDLGLPVRYSRDKNDYRRGNRYNDLFFKYDTLIPVIDALGVYGYINQRNGRSRYEDKTMGFHTRMWATPLLVSLFQEYHLTNNKFYHKPESVDVIRLNREIKRKNRKKPLKIPVNFRETKLTLQMRNDLIRYNEYVKKHHITVNMGGNSTVTYDLFINYLIPIISDNRAIITIINDNPEYNKSIYNKISYTIYNLHTQNPLHNITKCSNNPSPLTTITKEFSYNDTIDKGLYNNLCQQSVEAFCALMKGCLRTMMKSMTSDEISRLLNTEFQLKDIAIENLQIRLNSVTLHRVFNRGVKSMKYGGRAYGAVYQNIPSELRETMRINDEPTVEKDYSAFHIRMLYHLKGIEYLKDPYSVCAGKEYRDVFKCASLTIINAKNEGEAKGATRDELKDRGIPLPARKNPLNWLLEKFKKAHEPIAEYICADMGVRLQNIDSHIMNAILMRLMDKGILGLNVYDSVIVAKQHEDELVKAMTEEYEKVMGFKPVI